MRHVLVDGSADILPLLFVFSGVRSRETEIHNLAHPLPPLGVLVLVIVVEGILKQKTAEVLRVYLGIGITPLEDVDLLRLRYERVPGVGLDWNRPCGITRGKAYL